LDRWYVSSEDGSGLMHYFSVLVGFGFLSSEDSCCECHRRGYSSEDGR
jgi:hypothetical protein